MQVTQGCFLIIMPQQLLKHGYICAFIYQMSGKTMPKCVNAIQFYYAR
jgi:hypothetical protein